MGHYASEMTSPQQYADEQRYERERHERIAAAIKLAIEHDGIEHVLAQIVQDCEKTLRWNR